MAWGEESMTVREWRERKRWRARDRELSLAELTRVCGICGLDGRRHEFDCPLRDT